MLTAGDFCTRDVVVASPHDKIIVIARLMREHHVGSVVIVEFGPAGQVPLGILTDRDIVVGLVALRPDSVDRAVAQDLLSGKLVSALEDEDLHEVMMRMRSHGIRRVPVVSEQGGLRGIIAFDDLVDHLAQEITKLASVLRFQRNHEQRERSVHGQG